ncbi:MAG: rod shape-determining protein MreC [Bacteroidota bacterium]
MKRLFQLLWRNNFTLLFLFLWSLSMYLVVANNRFQQVYVFNSANRVVASVLVTVNYFSEYLNLKETNASLARENAELKSKLASNFYSLTASDTTVKDSSRLQQYTYMTARVVNSTVNRRNNYITLDKGRIHGVEPDMGVISSDGVVGIVKDVSEHYSTVMSILHKNSRVSARFAKNNYFGSVVWDGDNSREAELLEIAKHVRFKKGDTLVTTVFSTVFPEGVPVGTVLGYELKAEANFYNIDIRLSTDFARLSHVYIVKNLLKEEQRKLEQETSLADDN